MKHDALGTKLLMAVITLILLVYFGAQSYRYFRDPLTTTMAYAYEVEESISSSGLVVRSEAVLEDSGGGLLQLQRGEGERVSRGGTVAVLYADQASLDRQNRIAALESRIEQLKYVQQAAENAESTVKLDSQINAALIAYRQALAEGRLDAARTEGRTLRSLVLKRDYTYGEGTDVSGELAALEAERKQLQSAADNSVRRLTAPQSGLYSAVVDGYETVLTRESIDGLKPSELAALKPEAGVHSDVGKLVLGDAWYYAAPLRTEEIRELKKADGIRLRFSKALEGDLEVEIDAVGPEENGRSVVVFTSRKYLSELTLLRSQNAEIITRFLTGIRVPKEALRVMEKTVTKTDETGAETTVTEEISGIYCVVGAQARFKPVEVLYNGDGFLLVRGTSTTETTRLRAGDTVIVSAGELFDGKTLETAES